MNKLYYWPSFTKEETTPVINNSILSSTLSKKKNNVVALATATPQSKVEGEKNKITYSKKIKISKLNTNKKGSLINNKIIENLNSNNLNSSILNNLFIKRAEEKKQKIKKNTIISQYMKTLSINQNKLNTGPNLFKRFGTLLQYNKIISYSFLQNKQTLLVKNNHNNLNKEEIEKIMNSEYIENTYKLLFIFFKSIYCLISKPVISISPDKVNIQLFYYLNIPKKKFLNYLLFIILKNLKING